MGSSSIQLSEHCHKVVDVVALKPEMVPKRAKVKVKATLNEQEKIALQ